MLGLWIASITLVGVLLAAAAHLLERLARARRRWLWSVAMVAGPLLAVLDAVLGSVLPRTASADVAFGPGVPIWDAALHGLSFAATAAPARALEGVLAGAWALATVALVTVLAGGASLVRRRRRSWTPAVVDGVPVLVSAGFGPAVIGVRHPAIVLPPWVLQLPPEERALILAHEEEHRRRGDPRLLAAAFAFAVALPWNLPGWWALFRLRDAVETDCDARVLAKHSASRNRYARLLFEVGSRSFGTVPLGAGFGERVSSLERRIREMLNVRAARKRLVLQAMVAAVLVVAACTMNVMGVNMKKQNTQEQSTVTAHDAALQSAPTFTPFTVAPRILNRDEIRTALQRDYPPLLRDAGIGGTVKVYFFIDAQGQVQNVRIDKSSGHPALDEAALNVGRAMRFSPALNRDEKVPVWVSFPITFAVD
ncbi:MAG: TonB family protein [Gemmatimonadetes bacterium]|nr:TonB family protein [Gemmatimonadota bacterium]